jgi:hypothetical protein
MFLCSIFFFCSLLSAMPVLFLLYKSSLKILSRGISWWTIGMIGILSLRNNLFCISMWSDHFMHVQPGLNIMYYACSVLVHLFCKFFCFDFLSCRYCLHHYSVICICVLFYTLKIFK